MSFQDPVSRILAILDRAEPQMRRDFLGMLVSMKNQVSLDDLATLLSQGRIEDAFRTIFDINAQRLGTSYFNVYSQSGTLTATFFGDQLGTGLTWNPLTESSVSLMQQNQFRLINAFNQSQRDSLRLALTDGIQRGLNPRASARLFRDSIGLTRNQVQIVINYRRSLENLSGDALSRALRDRRSDGAVRRAIRDNQPLSSSHIDRLVGRYRERWIKYRSEVIARTESLRAVHQGVDEMYDQAIQSGAVASVTRLWFIAGDDRVRDSHSIMAGQKQPSGQPFISGAGNQLLFPGDPSAPPEDTIQCRCALGAEVVTISQAAGLVA